MAMTKLFLFFIIFALSVCGCKKSEKSPVLKDANLSLKTERSLIDNQESESLLKELRQKNPFKPKHSTGITGIAEIATGLSLKGIVWDSARPIAMIGNSMVVEKDNIGGKKVIKINKDSVELDNDGVREILKLD